MRSGWPVPVHPGARSAAASRSRASTQRRTSPRRRAPDRLAVTKALTAIDPDQPELAAARAAGIPVEPWQQVVADAAIGRTLVAVAGTHGKSTTSGWLVHALVTAGADPSAFVGALLPTSVTGGPPATARLGAGAAFVVEADEYAGNFDAYRPDVAILTGAEWDHPDVFADRAAVTAAFETWLRGMPDDGALVVNVGDPGAEVVVDRLLGRRLKVIAYAVADTSPGRGGYLRGVRERFSTAAGPAAALLGRIVDADRDGTTLEVYGLDELAGAVSVRLATAGRHNASNALAVAGAAMALGLAPAAITAGLGRLPAGSAAGWSARARPPASSSTTTTAITRRPSARRSPPIRQREPGRRVWAVYEPLTYHRTAAMLDAFADVLAEADAVAIADIWAGRDPDTTITSAAALADAVAARRPGIPVFAPGDVDATAAALAEHVRAGDAVLVMGGGHSYRIAEQLLARLEVT